MSSNSRPPKKRPFEKPKKRESELLNAADVLQALLQNSKSQLADGFTRWRLEQQWPQIVGATLAEQTLPAGFERGTLFIWVRHPVWMQQLYFFQEPIKEKVNAHLGRAWVAQVRFTLNRRAATTEPRSSGD
jgi:predicted nucleic acid-binding Zn ribbon protein